MYLHFKHTMMVQGRLMMDEASTLRHLNGGPRAYRLPPHHHG